MSSLRRIEKIIWTDCVRNEVLQWVKEETNILLKTNIKKTELFSHISRRNCLLKHITEGKIRGRIEVTGRWGRRSKKLLNDSKENTGYCKLKEEAVDHTLWRTGFWRVCGRMDAVGIHTRPNVRCSPSIFLKNLRKITIDFRRGSSCPAKLRDAYLLIEVKIVSAREILVCHS
jgi:hypothetical protein